MEGNVLVTDPSFPSHPMCPLLLHPLPCLPQPVPPHHLSLNSSPPIGCARPPFSHQTQSAHPSLDLSMYPSQYTPACLYPPLPHPHLSAFRKSGPFLLLLCISSRLNECREQTLSLLSVLVPGTTAAPSIKEKQLQENWCSASDVRGWNILSHSAGKECLYSDGT